MDRLRREGRVRELLSLGRQGFAPQLLSYLAAYPSLLWLAQAGGGQWGDAAATLLVAAQAEQDSVAARRRMMALAKLAAHAASPALDAYDARHPLRATASGDQQRAGGADAARRRDATKRRAEGELQALIAQDALGLGPEGERPRGPEELVAMVLQEAGDGPERAQRLTLALAALAAAPAKLRESHASLWEAAWQRLLDATDVRALAALRSRALAAAGGGEGGDAEAAAEAGEDYAAALEATPLCGGLSAAAAALLACTPAQTSPAAFEVLDSVGAWLRARAAGDRAATEVVEGAIEAAARGSAAQLMAAADA